MQKTILKIATIFFIITAINNTAQSDDDLLVEGAELIFTTLDNMLDNKTISYSKYGLVLDSIDLISEDNKIFLSAACIYETRKEGGCIFTVHQLILSSGARYPNEHLCDLRREISRGSDVNLNCYVN